MSIVRWNPFREMEDMLSRYALTGEGFPAAGGEGDALADWRPAVDIHENGDAYVFTVDVPAIDPEEIELTVREGVLAIKGERRTETRDDNEQVHRTERRYGRFLRSFHLPEDADPESVDAKAKHGTLEIRVAKKRTVEPKRIQVQAH